MRGKPLYCGKAVSKACKGMQNQALEQTRDSVLRYGESVGCELLNFFVRQQGYGSALDN
jgi:hypothetical protein